MIVGHEPDPLTVGRKERLDGALGRRQGPHAAGSHVPQIQHRSGCRLCDVHQRAAIRRATAMVELLNPISGITEPEQRGASAGRSIIACTSPAAGAVGWVWRSIASLFIAKTPRNTPITSAPLVHQRREGRGSRCGAAAERQRRAPTQWRHSQARFGHRRRRAFGFAGSLTKQ